MELYGGLVRNLEAAIEGAERLHGRPVHELTIRYWRDLIEYPGMRAVIVHRRGSTN